MRKLSSLLAATIVAALAETSAFDAGNINDSSSYGLTSNERILKERLDALNRNYLQIQAKLTNANEQIEGLQSTLEGINAQYNRTNSKFSTLEQNLSKELKAIKDYARESRIIQENNNKQIKQVLNELSQLMDTYLQHNETNSTEDLALNEEEILDESTWKNRDLNEVLALATKEFQNKNTYQNSKAKFEYLVEKNFRPARANFYLGEIEYKNQAYANAIVFYKKSVELYSKANYMPTLLYHTAISLDKVGDTQSANGFYQALKKDYPQSKEAKAAPNRK